MFLSLLMMSGAHAHFHELRVIINFYNRYNTMADEGGQARGRTNFRQQTVATANLQPQGWKVLATLRRVAHLETGHVMAVPPIAAPLPSALRLPARLAVLSSHRW